MHASPLVHASLSDLAFKLSASKSKREAADPSETRLKYEQTTHLSAEGIGKELAKAMAEGLG